MEKRYEELSKFFCFDRKKTSMEEFFGDLATFLRDFEVVKESHFLLYMHKMYILYVL